MAEYIKKGAYNTDLGYDAFRACLGYTVTVGAETVTVRSRVYLQMGDGHDSSSNIQGQAYLDGTYSDWVAGNGSYLYAGGESNWLGSVTKTFNRGTSNSSVQCSGQVWWSEGNSYSPWVSEWVTIPALDSYSITYNANGGSGTAPSKQTKYYGRNITLAGGGSLSRTGYTFKGWATKSTGGVAYTAGATYSANASVTLYAVWEIKKYTVSYNANKPSGASGSVTNLPASQSKTHGTSLKLSTTSPKLANYTFLGWGTSSSATTATYQPGGTFPANTNANTTLYAIWKLAYIEPKISAMSAFRSDSSGAAVVNPASDTTYITVKTKWSLNQSNGTNTSGKLVLKIGSTTKATTNISGSSGTTTQTFAYTLGLNTSVKITATLTDSFSSTSGLSATKTATVSVAAYPMTFANKGKSAAFFGMADPSASNKLKVFGSGEYTGQLDVDSIISAAGQVRAAGGEGILTGDSNYIYLRDMDQARFRFNKSSGIMQAYLGSAWKSTTYNALSNRTANTVLAAPDGSAGAGAFRKLVTDDLPAWSWTEIGHASGTSSVTINISGYSMLILLGYYNSTNINAVYRSAMPIRPSWLDSETERVFYLGGWTSSPTLPYCAAASLTKTKLTAFQGYSGSATARNFTYYLYGVR